MKKGEVILTSFIRMAFEYVCLLIILILNLKE